MAKLGIRLFLISNIGLHYLAYSVTNQITAETFVTASVISAVIAPVALLPLALIRVAFRPRGRGRGLDRVLFRFPTGDPFTLRALLCSACTFGVIGSGKSSSSGLFLARILLQIHSSGIVLASNPDDEAWWKARFEEAGRPDDLIVFSPTGNKRWNFLAELQKSGADAREVTNFLVVASEVLVESKGRDDLYWKQLSERMLYNVISALMLGGYAVTAAAISNFIGSAPYSMAQLQSEPFRKGFCNQVLTLAKANATDAVKLGDYVMLENYWKNAFVFMDEKPRSSAQSAVENITHNLSVGYARQLFSTDTNASCADLKTGKWILMNFPVSAGGLTSKLVYALAKLAVQKQVLRNHWTPDQPITVIWSDECWHVVNSFDRDYLAECRKHGGVLIYLTQSILNFNVAMGDSAQAKAASFLGMFGTVIMHASDVATAGYMVSLVGEFEQDEIGGSYSPKSEPGEVTQAHGSWSSSFNRKRMPVMTSRDFTAGMRMGGKSKTVDAWVYRAEAFRSGNHIIRMQFYQD